MESLTLKREETTGIWNAICQILRQEEERPFGFNYALIRNKKILERTADEIAEHRKEYIHQCSALLVKYCDKTKDGRAVILDDGTYSGTRPGESEEYGAKQQEQEDGWEAYLEEEVTFEPYQLKRKHLPKTLRGSHLEALLLLMDPSDVEKQAEEN